MKKTEYKIVLVIKKYEHLTIFTTQVLRVLDYLGIWYLNRNVSITVSVCVRERGREGGREGGKERETTGTETEISLGITYYMNFCGFYIEVRIAIKKCPGQNLSIVE